VLFLDELALHILCAVKASVPWSTSLPAKISCMISLIRFCILIDLNVKPVSFMDDHRRNLICPAESMP
jgi:hypothetical protein